MAWQQQAGEEHGWGVASENWPLLPPPVRNKIVDPKGLFIR